ncbi:hypothetical protein [Alkalicoccobacillus plakortidis]|uniref:Acyltransferase family protein n=1 Tax=Alkalicoccobacillus plakortidis TaxID=444060 RepID=A0ABT0XJL4_9BACI|nr:hypothetical protein [Alkalicoccobacillus plakortidis]MCM2676086.1 hypothetical protein [Alkalicoccobacillus plakortidis]
MNKRVKWIDVAKGLGIILVVMSHAPINDTLKRFFVRFSYAIILLPIWDCL